MDKRLFCGQRRLYFAEFSGEPVSPTKMWKHTRLCLPALWLFLACVGWAQSPDLAGIAHVALRAEDLAKSSDFYQMLGFAQAFSFTDAGKTSVIFIKINDRQFIELYPRTNPSQVGGLLHICYETGDIASVHDAYVRQGLQPTDVKQARAANLLFVMHDPEGQLLEYTQYLPQSLHSLDRGKHLDSSRIADHLAEATVPARDLAAQQTFYKEKLSFAPTAFPMELLLPGASGEKVQFISTKSPPRIVFAVPNLSATKRQLRTRGLKLRKEPKSLSITSPDGTILSFVADAAH
jgi:catechol 2,3-dioxygenase-like lactoylglutathione lyase family enzyme